MKFKWTNVIKIYEIDTANNWGDVETEMNIIFPEDYKEFINLYGGGGINEFLWILSPFSNSNNLNTKVRFKEIKEAYLVMKQEAPELCEYNFYNGEKGIFPWGITDNGDELYWNFTEEIVQIIVFASRYTEKKVYDMNMTEFLYYLLDKKIECSIFPDDFICNDNYYEV